MRVSVHQPDFIPWEGFWARTLLSDSLILITGVPHSRGDVTTRVKLDGNWVTIPLVGRAQGDLLSDLTVDRHDIHRAQKTLESRLCSKGNPYKARLAPLLELLSMEGAPARGSFLLLMKLNIALIHAVAKILEVKAEITVDHLSMEGHTKTERLYSVMKRAPPLQGKDIEYVTGAGGASYLEPHPGFLPLYALGAFRDATVLQLIARHPDPRKVLIESVDRLSASL